MVPVMLNIDGWLGCYNRAYTLEIGSYLAPSLLSPPPLRGGGG